MDETEKKLKALERKVKTAYSEAEADMDKTISDFFSAFAKSDEAMRAKMAAGEITNADYIIWRKNTIARGNRYKEMQSKLAERATKANETAVAYINDATPGVYALNRNLANLGITKATGASFTQFDETTVKRLISEEPETMPYYPPKKAVKRGIDLKYGKYQITKNVTSGIMQGKSIGKMATDLQKRIITMNRASAIRAARTSVTSAQNGGRMDSYKAASDMGIKLRKKWLATRDERTRDSHAEINGEVVDWDKPFSNGLMFPGDPSGPAAEVYNCRCTLVAVNIGF